MTVIYILAAIAAYTMLSFFLTVLTSPVLAAANFIIAKKYGIRRRGIALIPFVIHPYLGMLVGRPALIVSIAIVEIAVIVCGFLPWRITFFLAWFLFSFVLSCVVWKLPYIKKRYALIVFLLPFLLPLLLLTLIQKEI